MKSFKTLKTITLLMSLFIALQYSVSIPAADSDYDPQKAAAERIRQQLELANQMKAERLARERRQARQEEEEEKRNRFCVKAKDSLNQYEQARVRWYQLNEKGERVYLSADEINQRKQEIEKSIAENCQ